MLNVFGDLYKNVSTFGHIYRITDKYINKYRIPNIVNTIVVGAWVPLPKQLGLKTAEVKT